MLTIYRRHGTACKKAWLEKHGPEKLQGRKENRCKCPIWADGTLGGSSRGFPKSLGTRSWEKAQKIVRDWEVAGHAEIERPQGTVLIEKAIERYVARKKAKKLADQTLIDHGYFTKKIQEFCNAKGIRYVSQFTLALAEEFQDSWAAHTSLTAKNYLIRFRGFLKYCVKHGWVPDNYAADLELPLDTMVPTLPFTVDEVRAVLDALEHGVHDHTHGDAKRKMFTNLRAMCLVMRYSGLRISDCTGLAVDRIQGGKLFLYMAKTNVPVFGILPDFVLRELDKVERTTPGFYFWDGKIKLKHASSYYRSVLKELVEKHVKDFHPHRFRDTFAIELLQAGVPLERVSMLLGHKDIRVTQKHYGAWVKTRQDQMEEDLRRALGQDALAKTEAAKTQKLVRVK